METSAQSVEFVGGFRQRTLDHEPYCCEQLEFLFSHWRECAKAHWQCAECSRLHRVEVALMEVWR